MKKGISLFSLLLLLFVTTQTFAQVKFGVKAGLNLSNVTDKDKFGNNSAYYSMKTGFHLGVTAEFPVSEFFSFEPGLLYSTKGYIYKDLDYKATNSVNYLEIPMNAIYKINLGGAKLLVSAGPYVGYALSGKHKGTEKGYDFDNSIKIGNSDTDDMKALDYGLNIGAGVEIKQMTIGVQYGFGLANIATYHDIKAYGSKISGKGIGISVGYKFGSKVVSSKVVK